MNFPHDDLNIGTNSKGLSIPDMCDFGDAELARDPNALERFAPAEKGSVIRLAILSKPLYANVHYVESVGTGRCISTEEHTGTCCARLGDPQRRFVVLGLRYINAHPRTGNFLPGAVPQVEVGYLRMSRTNFASVSKLVPEGYTVGDLDIGMSKSVRGSFGYDFNLVSTTATWKKYPDVKESVEKEILRFSDNVVLSRKLGKVMTERHWLGALVGTDAETAQIPDNADDC